MKISRPTLAKRNGVPHPAGTFLSRPIRAATLLFTLALILIFTAGCPNKPPRVPDKPSGAETTYIRKPETYKVVTTDPNKNDVFYIIDWGDGTPPETSTTSYASGDTGYMSHKWATPGSYQVKASAMDVKGKIQKNWSEVLTVLVRDNKLPVVDSIIGWSSGAVNEPQFFRASATDEDGDSVSIRFYWKGKTGPKSDWSPWLASGIPSPKDSFIYDKVDTVDIYALAKDKKGSEGDFSKAKRFVIRGDGYIKRKFIVPDIDGEPQEINTSPAMAVVLPDTFLYIGTTDEYNMVVVYAHNLKQKAKQTHFKGEDGEAFEVAPTVNTTTNNVYFPNGDDGYIHAITTTGSSSWEYSPDTFNKPNLTPIAFTGNRLYYGSGLPWNKLWILQDNGTGNPTLLGEFSASNEISTAPVIDANNNVYFGDDSGYVYKLDANHQLQWKIFLGGAITLSPAIGSDGTIYFLTENGFLYAIKPDSIQKWAAYNTGGSPTSSPIVGPDGYVYFGDEAGRIHAVSEATGQPKSGFPVTLTLYAGEEINSSFAYANDGVLYVQISAVGAKKGAKTLDANDITSSPLIGFNGDIYVAGLEDDRILAVSTSGTVLWDTKLPDNALYQIQGRTAGTLANPAICWPMFRHDPAHSGKAGYTGWRIP